jgi:hypothetical protein
MADVSICHIHNTRAVALTLYPDIRTHTICYLYKYNSLDLIVHAYILNTLP